MTGGEWEYSKHKGADPSYALLLRCNHLRCSCEGVGRGGVKECLVVVENVRGSDWGCNGSGGV
jgi:hypothetical protein